MFKFLLMDLSVVWCEFLDAFTKSSKSDISFVTSVCPPARQPGRLHGTIRLSLGGWIFMKFDI